MNDAVLGLVTCFVTLRFILLIFTTEEVHTWYITDIADPFWYSHGFIPFSYYLFNYLSQRSFVVGVSNAVCCPGYPPCQCYLFIARTSSRCSLLLASFDIQFLHSGSWRRIFNNIISLQMPPEACLGVINRSHQRDPLSILKVIHRCWIDCSSHHDRGNSFKLTILRNIYVYLSCRN